MLEMICWDAERKVSQVARDYLKVGATVATVVCASLRGLEVFQLDIVGMWEYIGRGKDDVLPPIIKAIKSWDWSDQWPKCPYGVDQTVQSLASVAMSGLSLCWWLQKLVEVYESKGCLKGLGFG